VRSRFIAAIALSVALVAPHMARPGEIDGSIVWYQKPDALTTCIIDKKFDIMKQFGAANAYKAEEWCNTDIKYLNCIDAASIENKADLIKHARSLPGCVNARLPSNIAFDDIAQWVADQNLEELNGILLAPTIVAGSPK
jgi:hypothetical protein